jgi:hypothetical protein
LKKVTRRSMAAPDSGNPAEINTGQSWIPCRQDSNVTLTPGGSISDADGVVVEDFVLADLHENRGKAVHVREDRRASGIAGVGAGQVLGYCRREHFTSWVPSSH